MYSYFIDDCHLTTGRGGGGGGQCFIKGTKLTLDFLKSPEKSHGKIRVTSRIIAASKNKFYYGANKNKNNDHAHSAYH